MTSSGGPALEVKNQKAVNPGIMDSERKTPIHARIQPAAMPYAS